jgi:hypothetical protein
MRSAERMAEGVDETRFQRSHCFWKYEPRPLAWAGMILTVGLVFGR